MILTMLLAVQVAVISPTQSEMADKLAVQYFMQACADGTEHSGILTVTDGVLHENTLHGTAQSISTDSDVTRALCDKGPLIDYHCHLTNDRLSLFPGVDLNNDNGDFGSAASLAYMCAVEAKKNGFPFPHIEHRIVHTGGLGTITRYKLGGAVLQKIRFLGEEMGDMSRMIDDPSTPFHVLVASPPKIAEIHRALSTQYIELNTRYSNQVIQFLDETCPDINTTEDIAACDAFTLESFVKTLSPCDDYIIMPSGGAEPSPCVPSRGASIMFGERYPGFTELTPETYDAFVATGQVMLVLCSDVSRPMTRSCAGLLKKLAEKASQCDGLKKAFVDVSRYPELRNREMDGWPDAILMENGRRFTLTIDNLNPRMFGMLVCGFTFTGIPFK